MNVPSSINSDRVRPKTKRVDWFTSILFRSRLLSRWNLRASLCNYVMLIRKNAFFMSPQNSIGLNLERINISHIRFCYSVFLCSFICCLLIGRDFPSTSDLSHNDPHKDLRANCIRNISYTRSSEFTWFSWIPKQSSLNRFS